MKFITGIATAKDHTEQRRAIQNSFFSNLPLPFFYTDSGILSSESDPDKPSPGPTGASFDSVLTAILSKHTFDYILCIRDDTYVRPEVLEAMLTHIRSERRSLLHFVVTHGNHPSAQGGTGIVCGEEETKETEPHRQQPVPNPQSPFILSRRAIELLVESQSSYSETKVLTSEIVRETLLKSRIYPTLIPTDAFLAGLTPSQILHHHTEASHAKDRCVQEVPEADTSRHRRFRPVRLHPPVNLDAESKPKARIHSPPNEKARHQRMLREVVAHQTMAREALFSERGIVICGGGQKYLPSTWICIRMLRRHGCTLPIEVWHLGRGEMPIAIEKLLEQYNVRCVDALQGASPADCKWLSGWPLKCFAILNSRFAEVLLLDADNTPLRNPAFLFESNEYKEHGAVFWPDFGRLAADREIWDICGIPFQDEPEFESGQLLVDKRRCWHPLQVALHLNKHHDFYYRYIWGDKETFHLAWRILNIKYAMPRTPPGWIRHTIVQHDFMGSPLFLHRTQDKWSLTRKNVRIPGFTYEEECFAFLDEFALFYSEKPLTEAKRTHSPRTTHPAQQRLIATRFVFHRIGRDYREMSFLEDTSIGIGSSQSEKSWHLQFDSNQPELVIHGEAGIAYRLSESWDGTWRGHSSQDKPTSVELSPQPVRLGRAPTEHGHPFSFRDSVTRIIHQIWLGPKTIGRDERVWMRSWRRLHPDWEYRLWTDADVQTLDLQCREAFDSAVNFGMKADILRYELLNQYGGLYVDLDFECLKPIDSLLRSVDSNAFAGFEWPTVTHTWSVCNALLGAVPSSPFFTYVLNALNESITKRAPESEWHGSEFIPRSTGPAFLTRCASECGEITVFPQKTFYPRAGEVKHAFARHHFSGSWRT